MAKLDGFFYIAGIGLLFSMINVLFRPRKSSVIFFGICVLGYLGVLFSLSSLCSKEPSESLHDAATEAAKAAVEIAIGSMHVVSQPSIALLEAVDAGNHLSQALDHLAEAYAESERQKAEAAYQQAKTNDVYRQQFLDEIKSIQYEQPSFDYAMTARDGGGSSYDP